MLIFCSFSDNIMYQKMGYDGLKRLVEDLFQWDFDRLRTYLLQDDSAQHIVHFLDQGNGSGWVFVRDMLILKRQPAFYNQNQLMTTQLKRYSFLSSEDL
jgi:hypothetical protein